METIKALIEDKDMCEMVDIMAEMIEKTIYYSEDKKALCLQKKFEEIRGRLLEQHGHKELSDLISNHVLSSSAMVFVLSSDNNQLLYMYDDSWADNLCCVTYDVTGEEFIDVTQSILQVLCSHYNVECNNMSQFISDVVTDIAEEQQLSVTDTLANILAKILWGFTNKLGTVRVHRIMSIKEFMNDVVAKGVTELV